MEHRINEYIRGRRININDIDMNYQHYIYYNGLDYTITFYFRDINMKISYSLNENASMRLSQILDFVFNNYIPRKINENIELKVYFRNKKLQKIINKIK